MPGLSRGARALGMRTRSFGKSPLSRACGRGWDEGRPPLPPLRERAGVRVSRISKTLIRRFALPSPAKGGRRVVPSRRDELVPLADHVVVLVHHRIPAGDTAHAVVVGAAVARRAWLLEQRAVRRFDVL